MKKKILCILGSVLLLKAQIVPAGGAGGGGGGSDLTVLNAMLANAKTPASFMKVATGTLEAAGIMANLFYYGGVPGAASLPSPGMAGEALTSWTGQLPYTNPSSGTGYLFSLSATSSVVGTVILADRLWQNSGIDVTNTGAQTINSVAWPARDANGSTAGAGVIVALECTTPTTNASPVTTATISYTNSAGVSGRTGTFVSIPATITAFTVVPVTLQAGDAGIQSVQSITLGTSLVTGTVSLIAYRQLAFVPVVQTGVGMIANSYTQPTPLYNNTVPFVLWLPNSSAAPLVSGQLIVTSR